MNREYFLNMDINKQIIDQRIRHIIKENSELFQNLDEASQLSRAFLLLGLHAYLQINFSEAEACLTDGGGDLGIDAVYISDIADNDFYVFIFQAKYNSNLENDKNFPANSLLKLVTSIKQIFNPNSSFSANRRLESKINEIRSFLMDGYVPRIKCICLNNGLRWAKEGDDYILNAKFPKDQVEFEHFNHNNIIKQLQKKTEINGSIQFSGRAIVEEFIYKRVLLGKVSVSEIANLMNQHGDALLEMNIRKYLGLHKNRVNLNIKGTLLDDSKKHNFYFFNNGITMIRKKFSHNALASDNWFVKVEDMQIINGGQTAKTIQETLEQNPLLDFSNVTVLIRLYEITEEDNASLDLITDITLATNSQTPVDLRDLRANDKIQRDLGNSIKELGFTYRTKRGFSNLQPDEIIPSSVAAEAIYSVWKRKPHRAKYKRSELFGKFYEEVFENINGAQTILAVNLFRFSDAQRKKESLVEKFPHLPYITHFLSMLMGDFLLKKHNLTHYEKITHLNFGE